MIESHENDRCLKKRDAGRSAQKPMNSARPKVTAAEERESDFLRIIINADGPGRAGPVGCK